MLLKVPRLHYNREPFYGETIYKVYKNQNAITIDDTGEAVFEKTDKQGNGLKLRCNDAICALGFTHHSH